MRDLIGDPTDPLNHPAVRRAARTGAYLLLLVVLGVLVLSSLGPYTDYLWFAHDVRHPEVFSIVYATRGLLFSAAFVPTWALMYFSLRQAFTLSLVYLRRPDSVGGAIVSSAVSWIQVSGSTLVRFAAPLLAFFSAMGFANEWNTYLLATHAQTFGVVDPTFGIDVGFFVFTLPWYRAVSNYAFAAIFLTTVVTIGIYVGLQALAMLAKIELARPQIRFHVSLLLGFGLIVLGIQTGLKVFEAGFADSGQFTGAGYAAMWGVGALRVVSWVCIAAGVATIVLWKVGRPNQIAVASVISVTVLYFVGVVFGPFIVQRLLVDPNRLAQESPYAAKAIKMTRFAYGLDRVAVRETDVQQAPTNAEVASSQITLDNMRLWDPEILRQSFEGVQSIRPYYTFNDVDVDRYDLNGKRTMVMLAPRDVEISGLNPAAQNWTNERLVYTHGYGLVLVPVNAATTDGKPDFLSQGIPQISPPSLPITEPRIYFSDFKDPQGEIMDEYAIVRTGQPELDYQTDVSTSQHSWTGDRGVPIGGLLSRLAYSIVLGDGNLLVSPKVGGESRLLVHRNVIDRATRLFPFLKFDQDPYIVILNGRLVWVLDGYTMTENVPYSDRLGDIGNQFNYIRNSVKITIDAYTGVVTAFAVDPSEPILKAYRAIYPGLVRDVGELPAGLREHFRYAEDLFTVQTQQLTQYHVTDPNVFLSNGDAWQIPKERGIDGQSADIRPYYVQMKLPDEPHAGFLLIRPFAPTGKQTMSGWLAAHSDPEDYGRLTLYRFINQSPVGGPQLMEANFNSTPSISNINRQYNNGQSSILVGNLLVIPIGQSVMYVEPLYLRSETTGIQGVPRLFRVVLALNDKVVVGETYRQALADLFGQTGETVAETSPGSPANSAGPQPAAGPAVLPRGAFARVRSVLDMFDQADAALRAGDFAKYGSLEKQARQSLRTLVSKP